MAARKKTAARKKQPDKAALAHELARHRDEVLREEKSGTLSLALVFIILATVVAKAYVEVKLPGAPRDPELWAYLNVLIGFSLGAFVYYLAGLVKAVASRRMTLSNIAVLLFLTLFALSDFGGSGAPMFDLLELTAGILLFNIVFHFAQ